MPTRVRRLQLVALFLPVGLFALFGVWFAGHASAGATFYLGTGVATVLLLGSGAAMLRIVRRMFLRWTLFLTMPALYAVGIAVVALARGEYEWKPLRYAGVGVLLLVVFLSGWLPARRAERLVAGDLAGTGLVVPARVRDRYAFQARAASLHLAEGTAWHREVALADVGTVEAETVTTQTVHPVPGDDERTLTVSAGPAVRIGVPGGEWLLGVDDADETVRLIRERIANTTAAQP
jgi:hypothetical protein